MNREDIIRMAIDEKKLEEIFNERYKKFEKEFEEIFNQAVLAEREACAKVADSLGVHPTLNVFNGGPDWYKHGKEIAAAIRARGEGK